MKRVGNIWNKTVTIETIQKAHQFAREDKTFYKDVKMVDSNPNYYFKQIQDMLINHTYIVSPYSIQEINDKGKLRTLMKLKYFPDRIIQWVIMIQLEPIFLKTFCKHTCASIPKRGIKRVVRLTKEYLRDEDESRFCLQIDVKKFYDSINHEILKKMLRKKIKDKDMLWLLDLIIDSYPGKVGIPIGSYLSQYLANFYLCYFDHYLKEDLHIKRVVRYMDDMTIYARTKAELWKVLEKMREYLKTLELEIKGNWQIFRVNVRGVSFIGYRYFRKFILVSKRTLKRFKVLCAKVMRKKINRQKLNYREWCGLNSYIGWLCWCNSYHLFWKYILPLVDMMVEYYRIKVVSKMDCESGKKNRRLARYKFKLERHMGLMLC